MGWFDGMSQSVEEDLNIEGRHVRGICFGW